MEEHQHGVLKEKSEGDAGFDSLPGITTHMKKTSTKKSKTKPKAKKAVSKPKPVIKPVRQEEPIIGRPTKYNQEILDKAREYIKQFPRGNLKRGSMESIIPMVEELAYVLKVHKETLYAWKAAHEDFSDVMNEIKMMQAVLLANGSLRGRLNFVTANLMLNKHGYNQKIETENKNTTKLVNELESMDDDELERIAEEG